MELVTKTDDQHSWALARLEGMTHKQLKKSLQDMTFNPQGKRMRTCIYRTHLASKEVMSYIILIIIYKLNYTVHIVLFRES